MVLTHILKYWCNHPKKFALHYNIDFVRWLILLSHQKFDLCLLHIM